MQHDPSFFKHLSVEWFRIWEKVPNTHFFIKDVKGRIMACNRSFAVLMGGVSEKDILHKTAFDLCSKDLAIRYTEDDKRVLGGEEIVDQYEPNVGDQIGRYWYLTTKLPLKDFNGKIIGLIGMARTISSISEFSEDLKPILDYIHSCYATNISFPKLARSVNMSLSSVERRFKHYLGISPLQYNMRHRVIIAAEYLLTSNLTIAEIAAEVGFYDQTTLTRHFRKHKGITPHKFRKAYQRGR